jgi:hypothetical protein
MTAQIVAAQDLETRVFNLVCTGFLQTDDLIKEKNKIADVYVLEEPVSGSTYIQYPKEPLDKHTSLFRKYDKQKQLAILNADSIPIVPFKAKDTIYIVDTLRSFSGNTFESDGKSFITINRVDEITTNNKVAFLRNIIFRGDNIIVSFTFPASELLFSIELQQSEYKINLMKTSTLNLRALKLHFRE